jgi:hypothetical protein
MLRLVDFGFALDEIERGTLKGLALFAPFERVRILGHSMLD